ncbi:MAG: hypothetical protein ACXW2T_00380 [Allosphingosinicella sp.]
MIRRARLVAILLGLCAPAGAGQAQTPSASLDWLVGSWGGEGNLQGQTSEAKLEVRPALGGKFLELSYRLSTRGPRPYNFEGRAFYRPVSGRDWRADWFDSRGMVWPIGASVEGGTLTANWGTGETERGRTVYRLLPAGRLELVDTVRQPDGTWREFARHILSRAH